MKSVSYRMLKAQRTPSFLGRFNILQLAAFLLLAVVLLHTVRNLSIIYLFLYVLLILIVLVLSVAKNYLKVQNVSIFFVYIMFLCFSIWVSYWSIIYNAEVSFSTTISRLLFITIIPLVFIMVDFKEKDFNFLLKTFVLAVVLGAISYVYQYFLGSISWFNPPGAERGGLMRFSTSLGSLTIYGVVVGMALYVTYCIDFKKTTKVMIFTALLVGSFLSMQKAAFINIGIVIFFIMVSIKMVDKLKVSLVILLFLSFMFLLAYLYENSFLSIYFQTFLYNTLSINLFDNVNLTQTEKISVDMLVERIVGLHFLEIIKSHDALLIFIMGIGATGAGGAMGVESLQAHNSFWDLYFMGGVLYLLVFVMLFILVQIVLYKRGDKISNIFFILNLMFLINAFSVSIAMFHPVMSFGFWLSVIYVLKTNGGGLNAKYIGYSTRA